MMVDSPKEESSGHERVGSTIAFRGGSRFFLILTLTVWTSWIVDLAAMVQKKLIEARLNTNCLI